MKWNISKRKKALSFKNFLSYLGSIIIRLRNAIR